MDQPLAGGAAGDRAVGIEGQAATLADLDQPAPGVVLIEVVIVGDDAAQRVADDRLIVLRVRRRAGVDPDKLVAQVGELVGVDGVVQRARRVVGAGGVAGPVAKAVEVPRDGAPQVIDRRILGIGDVQLAERAGSQPSQAVVGKERGTRVVKERGGAGGTVAGTAANPAMGST
ncbi:MAG: hypothetical protein H6811_01605 [Phycisphaeraceae bacterium]|nr:hypothetical protein [Phycisphaeraceae bacterium]